MKRTKLLSLFIIILFLTLIIAGCGGETKKAEEPVAQKTEEKKEEVKPIVAIAADVVAPEHHLGQALDFFAQKVEEKSGGKMKIEVHHAGALGGERDILEGIKQGSMHFAAPGGGMLEIFYKPAGIFTYPYIFKDREHTDRVWDKLLTEFSQELEKESGFKGLAILNRPARNLSTSKPVKSVEDMKGLKIRVPETKMWQETFKSFGAAPTPLAFTELYTALKTGVVDGQDNPIALTYSSGFFEVNKYYSLIGHMYQDNIIVTSGSWFQSLPPDLQKVVTEAGQETQAYCRKLSLDVENSLYEKAEKEFGVEIIEPDLSGFRAAVDGLISEFPDVKVWYDKIKAID